MKIIQLNYKATNKGLSRLRKKSFLWGLGIDGGVCYFASCFFFSVNLFSRGHATLHLALSVFSTAFVFSRGHATLHLAVWVGPSVPP